MKIILISLFILLAKFGFAQNATATFVEVDVDQTQERNLQNSSNTYSTKSISLNLNIPLRRDVNESSLTYSYLGIRPYINRTVSDLNLFYNSHIFYQSGINGLAMKSNKKKSGFIIVTIDFQGDNKFISNITPIISGAGLYRYKPSPKYGWLAGLAYSFSYGRGLPLPILGFTYGNYNSWNFNFIVPLSFSFSSPKSNKGGITFLFSPKGFINRIENESYITLTDNNFFRSNGFYFGISGFYKITTRIFASLEIGGITRRKLSVSDANSSIHESIWSSSVENSPVLNFKILYSFKSSNMVDELLNSIVEQF